MCGFATTLSLAGIRQWKDYWIASDPGLMRLLRAGRTVLTVLFALFTVYLLIQVTGAGQPLTVPLYSGIVSLLMTIAVNDPTPKQQMITLLLLVVAAICAVLVGTSVIGSVWVMNTVLIAVIFAAVYVRAFGPRFTAMGMVVFISFYFASLVHAQFGQLPWLTVAVAVATGYAFLFRFAILPDRPEGIFRRSMRAFYTRAGLALDVICQLVASPTADEKLRKRLRRATARFNETALMVEGQLSDADNALDWPEARRAELSIHLFDTDIAIEVLADAAWHLARGGTRLSDNLWASLMHALHALWAMIREQNSPAHFAAVAGALDALHSQLPSADTGGGNQGFLQARRIELTGRQLLENAKQYHHLGESRPDIVQEGSPAAVAEAPPAEQEASPDEKGRQQGAGAPAGKRRLRERFRPTTLQAIQAAIAGALSVPVGVLLSPSHQYWAVLAAFVVLAGTGSAGKILNKAINRVIGTFLGAFAGFGVAHLVAGNTIWEILLAFVCVFMAFYFFSVSYGLMVFWTTTMLALMYDLLLGSVSVQLLQARFLDTLIGAGIGFIIALLIFPTRTTDEVKSGVLDFLSTLEEYVCQYLDHLTGAAETTRLTQKVRELDQKLDQVVSGARIVRGAAGMFGRSGVGRSLIFLRALDYYAKHLADAVGRRTVLGDVDRANMHDLLMESRSRLSANIEALRSAIEEKGKPSVSSVEDVYERIEVRLNPTALCVAQPVSAEVAPSASATSTRTPDPARAGLEHGLYYLRHINQAVIDLAVSLGAENEAPEDRP
jgi:uncharacterized membrane protein YccC